MPTYLTITPTDLPSLRAALQAEGDALNAMIRIPTQRGATLTVALSPEATRVLGRRPEYEDWCLAADGHVYADGCAYPLTRR